MSASSAAKEKLAVPSGAAVQVRLSVSSVPSIRLSPLESVKVSVSASGVVVAKARSIVPVAVV